MSVLHSYLAHGIISYCDFHSCLDLSLSVSFVPTICPALEALERMHRDVLMNERHSLRNPSLG